MSYDILFFDYGGMSIGNSLLESFSREFVNEAADNPNKYYVVVSTFTEYAVKDALESFNGETPHNVYLGIPDFVKNYNG
jgi:hypothetical protein